MRRWRLWLLGLVLLETCPTLTEVSVYKRRKGTDLTITCWSGNNLNVTRRVFCKNDCEEQDILAQTSGSDQTNGRYRIQHEKKGSPPQDFIDVTISNLHLNDSGRYRCLWDRPQQTSFSEFRVEVIEGLEESKTVHVVTAGEDYSHSFHFYKPGSKKSFCRNSCSEADLLVSTTGGEAQIGRLKIQYKKYADDLSEVTVTIKNTDISDSGAYQCRLDEKYKDFWLEVSPAPPSGDPAPPGQKPTGRPGGVPQTPNLTLILDLIGACVNIIILARILICLKRHAQRSGDRSCWT